MASLELETIKSLSQFSNLKAYYRFSSGALTTDSSGEGHTLTAISAPIEDASGKFGGAVKLPGLPTPTAWYRFESGALTTDSSGNGHTLTAISDPAEDASGKFGGAVALDGNDAYEIASEAHFCPTGNFTISAWVKVSTPALSVVFQSYSANTAIAGIRFTLLATSGVIRLVSGKNTGTSGTDYGIINGSTNVCDGTWHHVVGTWDGSYLNLYVDGSSDADAVSWADAPAYAATNYVRVGCINTTGTNSQFITGSLDDVALWNGVALNESQVADLYAREICLIDDAYSATDHADFKPTGNFSVGLWVKTITTIDYATFFSSYSFADSKFAGIVLSLTAGNTARIFIGKNTGATASDYCQAIGTTNVCDGTWHFVVGTWDGTNIKIYVDGTQDGDGVSGFNPVYQDTNYVRIGCNTTAAGANTAFLTGSLDDVFLLNGTALTAPQIKEIYEGWILTASAGSFALTGQASIFTRGYTLVAGVGSFVLTGYDTILKRTYILVAELGEFALTGYDVVFTRAYTLVASAGSFILTGVNATLQKAITLVAGAGSFILTGKDVILRQALNLIASVGEFTLTGYDVILKRTYILVAETGSFLLTGFSAFLTRGYILVAEAGSFILTGVSATLSKGYNLIAETGVFSVTVKSVQFLFNGIATCWGNITKPTYATYTSIDKPDDDIWTDITKSSIDKPDDDIWTDINKLN